MKYKISQLIMNNEKPCFIELGKDLELEKKELNGYRFVKDGKKIKRLTWVDDKNMKSIRTPDGRELTPEELFDFVLGNNITDFAKSKNKKQNKSDIAIVLGNGNLLVTRERALKAFELYKEGLVDRIIFTGGINIQRDKDHYINPTTMEEFMRHEPKEPEWQDLPEADWGAETFIPEVFDEQSSENNSLLLTEEFLRKNGIKPEDIIVEPCSTATDTNAIYCKNIFDAEELETGKKINSATIVSTCTHGARAMRIFKKVFGDKIDLKWCPSTLDLEKDDKLREILHADRFDEEAFRREFKRLYCTNPELIKKMQEEIANHRNAFILDIIDDTEITTSKRMALVDYFSKIISKIKNIGKRREDINILPSADKKIDYKGHNDIKSIKISPDDLAKNPVKQQVAVDNQSESAKNQVKDMEHD